MHSHDIGLVLAGGGGKGAYQIGALKAIEAAGLKDRITGISGSSVGALNTALFVYLGATQAERVWSGVKQSDFLNVKMKSFLGPSHSNIFAQLGSSVAGFVAGIGTLGSTVFAQGVMLTRAAYFYLKETGGLFSNDKIKEIINKNIDFHTYMHSAYDVFSTVSREKRSYYVEWGKTDINELPNLIMASSALPLIYAPAQMGGITYQDGGLTDNVPIRPLYDAGYRKFIVIYLENRKNKRLRELIIDEDEIFPNTQFLRIIPRNDMKDGRTAMITVNPQKTQRLIQLGYIDTLIALNRCEWLQEVDSVRAGRSD